MFWRSHNTNRKPFVLNTMVPKINSNPGLSNTEETNRIDATAPELSPIVIWSQKSSTFSGSESHIGEKIHQVDG